MTSKKTFTQHHDGLETSVEEDARGDWAFHVESAYIPGECQERASGIMEDKERAEQATDALTRIMRDEPLVDPVVRVGVAVFLLNEGGKILLGKRIGSHGAGTWALPGGHIELGETPLGTIIREVREETGLDITNVVPLKECQWGHALFPPSRKEYITLFYVADHANGEPRVMEPGKCESWEWFALDSLPSPLFAAIATIDMIEALRKQNA